MNSAWFCGSCRHGQQLIILTAAYWLRSGRLANAWPLFSELIQEQLLAVEFQQTAIQTTSTRWIRWMKKLPRQLPMDFDIYNIPGDPSQGERNYFRQREPWKEWSDVLRKTPGILDYSRAAIFAVIRSAHPEFYKSQAV
jgi:hypothetical protein